MLFKNVVMSLGPSLLVNPPVAYSNSLKQPATLIVLSDQEEGASIGLIKRAVSNGAHFGSN